MLSLVMKINNTHNNKASWPHSLKQDLLEKKPLRKDKKRINFIFLGDVDGASFESAHDLQVPSTVTEKITHHNPLSATLTVKRKK